MSLRPNAFEEFLRLTNFEWPDRYDSPLIGLFLLICDLAINPTRGFPLDIDSFENFICDVDPGARFTRLCLSAAEAPELAEAVQTFSALEYDYVSGRLTERCGYDHPDKGLDAVIALLGDGGAIDALMEEHRTSTYAAVNMPVRVMVSHYIAFCRDKRLRPEFFCWPGIWMAGSNASPPNQELFIAHLSLFQDRGDTERIFPRAILGRGAGSLKALVNNFYSAMLTFNLALQWTLEDGPFRYDFKWLTGMSNNTDLTEIAKRQFEHFYGLNPDAFELISTPVSYPT